MPSLISTTSRLLKTKVFIVVYTRYYEHLHSNCILYFFFTEKRVFPLNQSFNLTCDANLKLNITDIDFNTEKTSCALKHNVTCELLDADIAHVKENCQNKDTCSVEPHNVSIYRNPICLNNYGILNLTYSCREIGMYLLFNWFKSKN